MSLNPIPGELTRLLQRVSDGDDGSREALLAAVYQELHQMSMSLVGRESTGLTLSTTDVVHEAYLKLFGGEVSWENRRHFFSGAATAMRRILIDHARHKQAQKRQSDSNVDQEHDASMQPSMEIVLEEQLDLLALDHALVELASVNPRQAKIVELRYFAGLQGEEIAALLNVSRMTVHRDWQIARMRLKRSMAG